MKDRIRCDVTRHLAGFMATHAIGHDHDTVIGIHAEGVLIVLPSPTNICPRRQLEDGDATAIAMTARGVVRILYAAAGGFGHDVALYFLFKV